MKTATRRAVLAAALLATLWLVYRAPPVEAPSSEGAVVAAVEPPSRAGDTGADRQRRELQPASWDPFHPVVSRPKPEPRKVVAVPAPPPLPPPAPPPSAPPLPFSYFGLVADASGTTSVFVAQGSTLLAVRPGATLDGRYRVDTVGADEIVFTYLPLGERQVLRIPQ